MSMRRFGARWRDASTPHEVLDIFLIEGSYDVLLRNSTIDNKEEWADGIEIATDGFARSSFELQPHEARAFRYRNGKRRMRWADLPPRAQQVVTDWIAQ